MIKSVNKDIGTEVIDNGNLNTDMALVSIKLKQLIEDLRNASNTVQNNIRGDLSNLAPAIKQLNEACNLLNIIPTEVANQITSIAPSVASQILSEMNNNLTKGFTKAIDECRQKLNMLNNDIRESMDNYSSQKDEIILELESFRETKFKRNIRQILLTMIISIACSAGATYYSLTQFPQNIKIDHSGDINVEQSRVFVEGKSRFNTSQDTKVIKK